MTTTLVELLTRRAAATPDEVRFRFLGDDEQPVAALTLAQVDRGARALAVRLAELTTPGDRALLLYAPGLDFVTAFYGCLYAGVIAVPVSPPQLSKLQASLERLAAITANSGARLLLTTADLEPRLAPVLAQDGMSGLRSLATDSVDPAAAPHYAAPEIRADTVAYLQYSSGSTGEPRGVVLTHGNVLANLRLVAEHVGIGRGSVGVSWLPTYHDMGLLTSVTLPVYSDFLVVGMSALAFVQQPVRWIAALSRFGATHTVAPNFAYALAVRRVAAERAAEFDLSRLRVALCGAEPVRSDTLDAFADRFRPAGFSPAALYPCYGLAEATLFVTGGPVGGGLTGLDVDPAALLANRVRPVTVGGRRLAASGRLNDGYELVVADPDSLAPVSRERVGEICVRGDSVGAGYWSAPEASAATFDAEIPGHAGRFLRTGDLGFVHEGQLYVTGRRKDLILVDGHNHYPSDVEHTAVRTRPAIRQDRCAAFQLLDGDRDRLVLVAELDRGWTGSADLDEIADAVRGAIGEQHGLRVDELVFVAAGSIPLTTSGKIRRFAVREQYRDGTLATRS